MDPNARADLEEHRAALAEEVRILSTMILGAVTKSQRFFRFDELVMAEARLATVDRLLAQLPK